ncbi:hypothetical protein V5799_005722 [Amblyomma americanum]|uniref:C2H2-type domain-containing protein n=1 Tax=Amblyomma americanum TaxID=6943 RepID=A0AAQ4DYF7_AMBAM
MSSISSTSSTSTSSTSTSSSDSESPPTPPVKRRRRRRQPIRPHGCPNCPKSFRRAQDLATHVRRHEGGKPYRCSICDKTFCTAFELDQHTPSHTGERAYSCRCCPQKFVTRSALHNHLPTHLPLHRRTLQCRHCPAQFASVAKQTAHERTHSSECPYRCDVCGRAFPQRSNLLRHMQRFEREKDKNKASPCPNCSKVFHGQQRLEAHRRTCRDFHRCSSCGKGFVLEADLKAHVARKHKSSSESSEEEDDSQGEEEDGTLVCAQGREGIETSSDETEHGASDRDVSNTQPTTAKKPQWSLHVKLHVKENKAMKRSRATSHRRGKHGETPADRGGSDDNQFSSSDAPASQLPEMGSKHLATDTAVPCVKTDSMAAASIVKMSCPRYKCPKCKEIFVEWDALKSHMALEHKEQLFSVAYVFQCHLCDKTFKQNSNLKTHLKSHDRVVSFVCDVCGEGFALKHHLKRHKDRKHSVES